MISKWNYLPLTSEEQDLEIELAKKYAGSPAIAELLVQRGITSVDDAEHFFNPSLSDLHDPFLMKDMDKAVDRLNMAMGAKEKILVYGDYDVDGTTAVSLVYKYLRNYYSHIEYYIPTRDEEGYGISIKSIDYAASIGVKLIIVRIAASRPLMKSIMPRKKALISSYATTMSPTTFCRRHMPFLIPRWKATLIPILTSAGVA